MTSAEGRFGDLKMELVKLLPGDKDDSRLAGERKLFCLSEITREELLGVQFVKVCDRFSFFGRKGLSLENLVDKALP